MDQEINETPVTETHDSSISADSHPLTEDAGIASQEQETTETAENPPDPQTALLDRLCTRYGVAAGDMEALEQAVEQGLTLSQQREAVYRAHREAMVYQTYQQLLSQAEELRQLDAQFDWQQALQDPRFVTLLRHPFLTVRDAYEALYGQSVLSQVSAAAEQKGRTEAFRTLLANRFRPWENGNSGQGSTMVKQDVSRLTKEERRSFIRRARAGERVSF